MIPCTECRDYNIEKVLRCEQCCRSVLGYFIEGCSPACPRNEETTKVSALCSICNSHLRKESRCCRYTKTLTACKKLIRAKTVVFVQNPSVVENPTPKDRPCSHYSLCQHCKKAIVKGHRSSTACKDCKLKPIITGNETQQSSPQKRTKVQFCLETGMNLYVPPTKKPRLESSLDTLANLAKEETEKESIVTKHKEFEPGWRFGEFCRIPVTSLLS